jgi:hypothetical protein
MQILVIGGVRANHVRLFGIAGVALLGEKIA